MLEIDKIIENPKQHCYIYFRIDPISTAKDCEILNIDSMGVDIARDIARQSCLSTDKVRKIIINCNSINVSSQNALLKAFEDPSSEITFILSVPYGTNILDTIKSRAEVVYEKTDIKIGDLSNFFDMNKKEKLEKIDNIYENGQSEYFLNIIEKILHLKFLKNPTFEVKETIDTLYKVRYMFSKVNTKNILYNLAF